MDSSLVEASLTKGLTRVCLTRGLRLVEQMAQKLARKVLAPRRTSTLKFVRAPIGRPVLGTALQQSHPVVRLRTSRRMGMPVQTQEGTTIPFSLRR